MSTGRVLRDQEQVAIIYLAHLQHSGPYTSNSIYSRLYI